MQPIFSVRHRLRMFQPLRRFVVRFHSEEHAATIVEYAILLALIAAICILSITATGGVSSGIWQDNASEMDSALRK